MPPQDRPTPLAAYLAASDAPCPACGYNLRGGKDPFCPECGAVIPRPGSGELAEAQNLLPRRLWCRRCGYDLHSITTDQCPECGESALIRVRDDDPLSRPPARNGRALTMAHYANAVLGLVILAFGASLMVPAMLKGLTLRPRKPGYALTAAILLAAPLVLGTGYLFARSWLREQEILLSARRSWLLAALGFLCVAGGLMLLLEAW